MIILIKSVPCRILESGLEDAMATITKKELIDRIAETAGHRRVQVKKSCVCHSSRNS